MNIAIIRYTESTGREYIVDITNDLDKWIVDNNSTRDEEFYEKLSDFDIEWTTLKNYENNSLEKKVALLEEHNTILFDYVDNKMVEGCEEATKLINNLIK